MPLLPAAAQKTCPTAWVPWMASNSAWEKPPPPQLLFETRMPLVVQYETASTASDVNPPWGPRKRSGTILQRQLTPATPTPLFPTAPTVPAQWLPWPSASSGLLSVS